MSDELRDKMATACRILGMEGLVNEILGHISVRVPDSDEMWIRCRSPREEGVAYTQADAIQRVTLDGAGAEEGYQVPKEAPIHSETYRARPDVNCVIHAHPPAALLASITGLELKPVFGAFNIPALRLALDGVPVFPRACLITRAELAHELLGVMGDHDVCLMRGHGLTVTGRSVEETLIRALNFNTLAKVTVEAAKTGRQLQPISAEDVAELPNLGRTFNEEWVWRFYVRKLRHWEAVRP